MLTFVPVQPMHQFSVPGAASTLTCGVVTFQATLQVSSVAQLAKVLSRIEQVKDVHTVQRDLGG